MYDANNFGRAAGDTIIASAKFFHLCVYMAEEFTVFKYLLVCLLKYIYRPNVLCSLDRNCKLHSLFITILYVTLH